MDGVITDLVGDIQKHYNHKIDWSKHLGQHSLHSIMDFGLTYGGFWDLPIKFWSNMTPDLDMWGTVSDYIDEITIVSYPINPDAAKGKLIWVKNTLPEVYEKHDWVFTKHKHLLANSNTLLIDDLDGNVECFRQYGGKTILVPRPWNRNHRFRNNSSDFVKDMLEAYCG